MNFDTRKIALFILIGFALILFVGIPISIYQDYQCEKRGGVPSRVGCLDPKVFK
jgi:hypothetical protein